MERSPTRWFTLVLFILFGVIAAWPILKPSSDGQRTYRYAALQTTEDGEDVIFSHARDKSYRVQWSKDSDREAVQTLTELLAHGVTGEGSQQQDVFVKGTLQAVLYTNSTGIKIHAFVLRDWHIKMPFYFLTTWEPAPTDQNRRSSLKEIGLDTYDWNGEIRSYSRYER